MSTSFYRKCRRWVAGTTEPLYGTELTTPDEPNISLKSDSNNLQSGPDKQTPADQGLPPSYGSLLQPYEGPSKGLLLILRGMSKDEDIADKTVKDEVTRALEMAPTISISIIITRT
ncbi:hypothetical protein DL93DRAFT_2234671, partial [Clavulina sp. PMI_390]